MEFPARVTLLSGAVVLLANTSQMDAIPLGSALEPIGSDGIDGTHLYREVLPSMAGEAMRLRAELQAAADALEQAATLLREGPQAPIKAQRARLAADRAKAALEEPVHA